jgi:8-oxo-dGTP diphosphatase
VSGRPGNRRRSGVNFTGRRGIQSSRSMTSLAQIQIAAAIICDEEGRTLLVRKRNTIFFMQPGGKLDVGETALETLERELSEELGCTLRKADFLGVFTAPAANEHLRHVQATLFHATITGKIRPGAEIEEIVWVEPCRPGDLPLAPLTRDHVLPLVRALRSGSSSLSVG